MGHAGSGVLESPSKCGEQQQDREIGGGGVRASASPASSSPPRASAWSSSAKRERSCMTPGSAEKQRQAAGRREAVLAERQLRASQHVQHVERVVAARSRVEREEIARHELDLETRLEQAEMRRARELENRAARAAIFSPLRTPAQTPVRGLPQPNTLRGTPARRTLLFGRDDRSLSAGEEALAFDLPAEKVPAQLKLKVGESKIFFDAASRSFEETTALVQSLEAKQASQALMNWLLGKDGESIEQKDSMVSPENAASMRMARVLLSCIVIAYHHEHVMDQSVERHPELASTHAAEDLSLHRAALAFVEQLAFVMADPVQASRSAASCAPPATRAALRATWTGLFEKFRDWKRRDAQFMVDGMIKDAILCIALRESIAQRGMVADRAEWDAEIEKRLDTIRTAVRQVGGEPALRKLEEALVADEEKRQVARLVNVQSENEFLVHEILVDPAFDAAALRKCLHGPAAQLKASVARTMKQAFWDGVVASWPAQGSDEHSERREVAVVAVNEALIEMWQVLKGISPQIPGAPNDDSEMSMLRNGPQAEIARLVASLRALQAEASDEGLDAWLAEADAQHLARMPPVLEQWSDVHVRTLSDLLMQLLERIENVRVECSVARIAALIPLIRTHGPDWEREQLCALYGVRGSLDFETLHLPGTCAWLTQARQMHMRASALTESPDPQAEQLLLLRHALIDTLAAAATGNNAATMPVELLRLDAHRIRKASNELHGAIAGSVVIQTALTYAQSCASTDAPSPPASTRTEAGAACASVTQEVLQHLTPEAELDTTGLHDAVFSLVEARVRTCHDQPNFCLDSFQREMVASLVQKSLTRPDDALRQLIQNRILVFTRASFCGGGGDVIASSTAPSPATTVLDEAVPFIQRALHHLRLLETHLIHVHAQLLARLLQRALRTNNTSVN
ncbi:hypothetical protein FVE85_2654 [Porphyridium purpureum]|uniref:T-complex protein 11-like protein 1 n=1 Tax=Porphyridium purpureum TaxID=35688 RepID=A0A5J4YUH3_PORPP|nr:hypothetical protein FVE85_2654 [Porphyridium purpureum]|eukprot:POR3497..scf227_4